MTKYSTSTDGFITTNICLEVITILKTRHMNISNIALWRQNFMLIKFKKKKKPVKKPDTKPGVGGY